MNEPNPTGLQEQRRRVARTGATLGAYFLTLLAAVAVINAAASHFFARVDLTHDQRYTLSDASRTLVSEASRPIEIYAFLSSGMPAPYDTLAREIQDLLAEYQAASGGNLRYSVIDPGQDAADRERAANFGVMPVAIGEQSRDAFSVKEVYMGIAMVYQDASGDRTDKIPQIFPGMNHEYEITRRLRDLVRAGDKPTLAIVIGDGSFLDGLYQEATKPSGFTQPGDPTEVKKEITDQFEALLDNLFRVTLVELTAKVPDDVDGLLLLGPTKPFDEAAQRNLDEFVMRGKGVAVMASPYKLAGPPPGLGMADIPSLRAPDRNLTGLEDMLEKYGARINPDAILDREAPQLSVIFRVVGYFQDQPIQQPLPAVDPRLPLITDLNRESLIVPNIPMLAFTPQDRQKPIPVSSLTVTPAAQEADKAGRLRVTRVASSSASSVRRPDTMTVELDAAMNPAPGEEQGPFPVIVSFEGELQSAFGAGSTPNGRVLVASNGDFITNVFNQQDPLYDPRLMRSMPPAVGQSVMQYRQSAIVFLRNLTDWLVSDTDLVSIRGRGMPQFIEVDKLDRTTKTSLQVGNIAGIPVFFGLVGLFAWARRRSRRQQFLDQFRSA